MTDRSTPSVGQPVAVHFDIVDSFRGLAAIYVLLFHSAGEIYGSPVARLFAYGVQAVLLFFVISGLCIHLRPAEGLAADTGAKLDLRSYGAKRFWRIYPPFAVAVLATVALDGAGRMINPAFYADLQLGIGETLRPITADWRVVAGNFLCLQPQIPVIGTNGPLWSLGYEAVFYLLYPAYFLASRRLGAIPTAVAGVVVGIAALAVFQLWRLVLPFHILALWSIWVLGALIADRIAGRTKLPVGWWIGAAGFAVLAFCIAGPRLPSATLGSLTWGGAFALLVAWAVLSPDPVARGARAILRPVRFTAHFSYSLYLIQAPVLALVRAARQAGVMPHLGGAGDFVVNVMAGLAGGLILYALIERVFDGRPYRLSGRFPFLVARPRLVTADA